MKNFLTKESSIFISFFLLFLVILPAALLNTPTARAACITATECPSGQIRGAGPCADPGQINCIPDPTSSGSTATGSPEKIELENPLGGGTGITSVPRLIGNIIKTILTIVGALALGMFVYGGFTWMTSGGSSEKIQKGKNILIWAVIGLVIIFSSYTLVDFVLTAFGL